MGNSGCSKKNITTMNMATMMGMCMCTMMQMFDFECRVPRGNLLVEVM